MLEVGDIILYDSKGKSYLGSRFIVIVLQIVGNNLIVISNDERTKNTNVEIIPVTSDSLKYKKIWTDCRWRFI